MAPRTRDVSINISGISVSGVGGLGLVAIAALTTYVLPQAWWLVAIGAFGGLLLGIALVVAGRHHTASGPSGDDPLVLFRAAPDDHAGVPSRERDGLPLESAVTGPA
ncbi:MAG TPA: hypothetical protein VNC21_06820 [Vicinamibacterales bacterium]|nr:hypothetical protein [Vicinamibacterales bacterium]